MHGCQNPSCFYVLHTFFHSIKPFDNFIILWEKNTKEQYSMPYRYLDASSQPLVISYEKMGFRSTSEEKKGAKQHVLSDMRDL